MRISYGLGLLASLLFVTGEARPCGGAFGTSYTIQPAQKIVVAYRDGVETYIFNPNFCGKADSFGLILPIPTTLTEIPTLGESQLYTDLATLAAPTVVTTQACAMRGSGGSSSYGTGSSANGGGATVIQRGQVGIFDWTLLQATSVDAFTEWLTNNGYPYPSNAVATFQSYVDNGWYFVAFKVSTGGASGSAGSGAGGSATTGATGNSTATICGSFGPVALSFAVAPNPVIPARIASVSSSSLSWDIFAIGTTQMRLQGYSTTLQFSGAMGASDLTRHPTLAGVAEAGDRLTELLLTSLPSTDLVLEADPNQADYRRVVNQVQYVLDCSAGASAGGGSGLASAGGSGGTVSTGGSGGTVSTGGLGSPGIGGAAAGGTGIGGMQAGGEPASVGGSGVGGEWGTGGTAPDRAGGAAIAETPQAGASAVESESEPNSSGCDCSIPKFGDGTAPRGLGILGLLGVLGLVRRRRLSRRG